MKRNVIFAAKIIKAKQIDIKYFKNVVLSRSEKVNVSIQIYM